MLTQQPSPHVLPAFVRYEHPLNERVRTYLRFEALFRQLQHSYQLKERQHDHLFFSALFDILELLDQIQLKAELIKDLDKQRQKLQQWLNVDNVDQTTLLALLDDLEHRHHHLLSAPRLGQTLREDRFLSGLRQRFSIPGGTCCFDLPTLQHWRHLSAERRQQDITRWMAPLNVISHALSLWLRLIRDSAQVAPQVARQGFYQSEAAQAELLRLQICPQYGVYPMISGLRSRFSIRFLPFDEGSVVAESIEFSLARC
ncbi:cell division protein ZapD [Thaumasiovibrio sp. DFM-14]|uniref:cell division protein ZapD n=1 Tax=Thaumasiovibrio sp. DFM-14 TaxID=3384792 RepID=UPI0039A112BA